MQELQKFQSKGGFFVIVKFISFEIVVRLLDVSKIIFSWVLRREQLSKKIICRF